MTVYKRKMKTSAGDVTFISLLALTAFMVGWYVFTLFIALILALLVAVVGIVRMKRTRTIEKLNAEKELYQETLFKK